jgi:hypothetical protein
MKAERRHYENDSDLPSSRAEVDAKLSPEALQRQAEREARLKALLAEPKDGDQ